MDNQHIRHDCGVVRPYIYATHNMPQILKELFGAEVVEERMNTPENSHVLMQIGESIIVMETGALPLGRQTWKSALYVYVPDVDATYLQALQMGFEQFYQPTDQPYGERLAGFTDTMGNMWYIAMQLPDQPQPTDEA